MWLEHRRSVNSNLQTTAPSHMATLARKAHPFCPRPLPPTLSAGKQLSMVGEEANALLCFSFPFLILFIYLYLFLFFCFLGTHPQHMEVPRLGIELELQLPAYTTAIAMQDLSCFFDLHHSPRQCWILNTLSEARDPTCNLVVPSQIRFCCAMMGIPVIVLR